MKKTYYENKFDVTALSLLAGGLRVLFLGTASVRLSDEAVGLESSHFEGYWNQNFKLQDRGMIVRPEDDWEP
jgi:hypothetical protein